MIPEEVSGWLAANDHGEVAASRPVAGGCINNGVRLETTSGAFFFLKTNTNTPEDMFVREAEGLQALRVPGGPRVPEPYLHGPGFLLMEDLAPASRGRDYWPGFGRRLAALHNNTNEKFGFAHDNYIGSTPQPNPWAEDGHAFFAGQRLRFQAQLAQNKGLLNNADAAQIEGIAARLPDLIPLQSASLLHGDLWSGNATVDAEGQPAVIDPAVYYGWAEADLAMTDLFGGFHPAFYAAYEEARPLEPGWRERFPIYNLYHLLNHLNLFGRGYYRQTKSILERFAA